SHRPVRQQPQLRRLRPRRHPGHVPHRVRRLARHRPPPREVCALPLECLEIEGGEYSLIYHNYKKQRLRRRLPVTAATAAEIQTWQHRRAGLPLPESAREWLFPAMTDRASRGHLATNKLTSVMRAWINAIPIL